MNMNEKYYLNIRICKGANEEKNKKDIDDKINEMFKDNKIISLNNISDWYHVYFIELHTTNIYDSDKIALKFREFKQCFIITCVYDNIYLVEMTLKCTYFYIQKDYYSPMKSDREYTFDVKFALNSDWEKGIEKQIINQLDKMRNHANYIDPCWMHIQVLAKKITQLNK